jgi:branched-chain amino acid aminotransferase
MQLAPELGYEVTERDITRSELYVADEVFMTGTAAEVLPISSIDDRNIGGGKPGPITLKLAKGFSSTTMGKNKKFMHWLDFLN